MPGTPGISDPGEDLVRICYEQGIEVTSLPGAAACITALTLSGLPTRRFSFEAFLPKEKKERAAVLEELKNDTRTLIVYEAPHHLLGTLKELQNALGDRRLTVCRELTKKFETAFQTTFSEAIRYYEEQGVSRRMCSCYRGQKPRGTGAGGTAILGGNFGGRTSGALSEHRYGSEKRNETGGKRPGRWKTRNLSDVVESRE